MIKDSFWTDSYVANLDPIEKLLYLYLLTNPLCNIAGIYEIQNRRIAFDTGIDKDMVEKMLNRFENDGKILRHHDWLILVNYAKHQSYKNPNVTKGIGRIIEELPIEVKALKGFERLSHFTLLNLTLPNLTVTESKDSENTMSWNKQSDDYLEGTINLDGDGTIYNPEAEAAAAKKEQTAKFRKAIDWLIDHQGRDPKRTSIPKQLKAIQKLYTMGVSSAEARQIILECEGSPQWQGREEKPDYWTVVAVIQKRG